MKQKIIQPLTKKENMKQKIIVSLMALAAASIITACGDEVNEVNNTIGLNTFETIKNLPKCTEENEGEMVLVTKDEKVYYCAGSDWQELNGKNGADGTDGKDGADGVNGKDGAQGEPGKDGADGVNGKDGAQGEPGKDGADGTNGKDGAKGDKGEKGDTGATGTSCTAQKVDEGIEVSCGGNVVGILTNGVDGAIGNDGEGCKIEDDDNGILTVTCDGVSATMYKAMCGISPYDPKKETCKDGKFVMVDERDNQEYRYVKIGTQTWMAENLNYAYLFKDNDGIKPDSGSYCFGDDGVTDRGAANCEKYGRLYRWSVAIDSVYLKTSSLNIKCGHDINCNLPEVVQGVCPAGWHLPTRAEWMVLYNFVIEDQKLENQTLSNNTVGLYLKSPNDWQDDANIPVGKDTYGFSALGSGSRHYDGNYQLGQRHTHFWSANQAAHNKAFSIYLDKTNNGFREYDGSKLFYYSVRCVKNSK